MPLPVPTADFLEDFEAHRIAEAIWSDMSQTTKRSDFLLLIARRMGSSERAKWAFRAGVDRFDDDLAALWPRVCESLERHQRALRRPKASP